MTDTSTRDRLLRAARELLRDSDNGDVSTRAICERSGVQAPTLYHYFGNKQGLLDAVVVASFTEYMLDTPGNDPVEVLRASWDRHVRFGLENPTFYLPGTLSPTAEQLLVEQFNQVARHGRLRVAPDVVTRQLVAANVGATLRLLAEGTEPDFAWSTQLRDAVLDAVLTDAPAQQSASGGLSSVAVALLAALDDDQGGFTAGELTLLREWLHRVTG